MQSLGRAATRIPGILMAGLGLLLWSSVEPGASAQNGWNVRIRDPIADLLSHGRSTTGLSITVPDGTQHNLPVPKGYRPPLKIKKKKQIEQQTYQTSVSPEDERDVIVDFLVLDSHWQSGAAEFTIGFTDEGMSPGPEVLSEQPSTFLFDTGPARFEISREGWGISGAWSQEVPLLGPGDSGLWALGVDGALYSAQGGVSRSAVLRNGAAAAVVEIQGELADASGNVIALYTLHSTAFRGESRLTMELQVDPLGELAALWWVSRAISGEGNWKLDSETILGADQHWATASRVSNLASGAGTSWVAPEVNGSSGLSVEELGPNLIGLGLQADAVFHRFTLAVDAEDPGSLWELGMMCTHPLEVEVQLVE